jgi:hypothetical protein
VSALQFHGLTLQMASSVWMAIERTAWRPRIDSIELASKKAGGGCCGDRLSCQRFAMFHVISNEILTIAA